jgi:hypothetical protein
LGILTADAIISEDSSIAISPLSIKIINLFLINFLYKSTRHCSSDNSSSDLCEKQNVLTSSTKASDSIRVCNGMPKNCYSLSLIYCDSFSINALA